MLVRYMSGKFFKNMLINISSIHMQIDPAIPAELFPRMLLRRWWIWSRHSPACFQQTKLRSGASNMSNPTVCSHCFKKLRYLFLKVVPNYFAPKNADFCATFFSALLTSFFWQVLMQAHRLVAAATRRSKYSPFPRP